MALYRLGQVILGVWLVYKFVVLIPQFQSYGIAGFIGAYVGGNLFDSPHMAPCRWSAFVEMEVQVRRREGQNMNRLAVTTVIFVSALLLPIPASSQGMTKARELRDNIRI